MANLFIIEGNVVNPTPEILLVEPFKTIWERDTTTKKYSAREEFAYIEFMSSARKSNPYRGYSDEERPGKIVAQLFSDKNWSPDHLVLDGIAHWREYQKEASTIYTLWRSAKIAADKLSKFLRNINPDERDEKGKPVYKPRDITSALNDVSKVVSTLNMLEEKVEEELYEETRNRGDKTISPFADASSL